MTGIMQYDVAHRCSGHIIVQLLSHMYIIALQVTYFQELNSKIIRLEKQVVGAGPQRTERRSSSQDEPALVPSAVNKECQDSLLESQQNIQHLQLQVTELYAKVTCLNDAISAWSDSKPHVLRVHLDSAMGRILNLENKAASHALPDAVEKLTEEMHALQAADRARDANASDSADMQTFVAANNASIRSDLQQLVIGKLNAHMDVQKGAFGQLAQQVATLATQLSQFETLQKTSVIAAGALAQRLQGLEAQTTPLLREVQNFKLELNSLDSQVKQHAISRSPVLLTCLDNTATEADHPKAGESAAVEATRTQSHSSLETNQVEAQPEGMAVQSTHIASACHERVDRKLEALSKTLSSLQQASEHTGLLELAGNGKEGCLVHAVACAHTEEICAQAMHNQTSSMHLQLKTIQEIASAANADAISAQQRAEEAAACTETYQQGMQSLLHRVELLEDIANECSGNSDAVSGLRITMQQLQVELGTLTNLRAQVDHLCQQVHNIDDDVEQVRESVAENCQMVKDAEFRLKNQWDTQVADLKMLSQEQICNTIQPIVDVAAQQSKVAQEAARRIQEEICILRQTVSNLKQINCDAKEGSDEKIVEEIGSFKSRLDGIEENAVASVERTALLMEEFDELKVHAARNMYRTHCCSDLEGLWVSV
jgi:hypothetical protein